MPKYPRGPVSSAGEPLQAGDPLFSSPGSACKTIRYDGSGYIFQTVQTQINNNNTLYTGAIYSRDHRDSNKDLHKVVIVLVMFLLKDSKI